MAKLLHPKATAVWLVDNTTLTFKQIADFTDMHELEIQGIADGDVAAGVKGFDPLSNNQIAPGEIEKAEKDPLYKLKLKHNPAAVDEDKRRGPRYTPLSKRQDRPASILWLVKFHPELSDAQISKLVGTTKPTIQSIRERTHWNISNLQPIDPVALGLCRQSELDAAVAKASKNQEQVMNDDERRKLVSTEQSLDMDPEPRLPSSMEGLESFSLSDPRDGEDDEEEKGNQNYADADSFFNLPDDDDDESEDKDERG
ncbi:hypothetical protein SAMN05421853_104121 [Roseivivax halotolerans]|uniref:Cytoplasmic protein n=1 Tax=Roseivivax halotolerans TaxID=93684 RepID=A0A1I5XU35_9RHOB|nr:cell cycle transcriptional regulator TrcR [Roseivivax halotolerans]SFQ35472.1 hypothetical protein SAMN05421853_104121 [Roseivivax halotolerans]